jgi:hypothetical protein
MAKKIKKVENDVKFDTEEDESILPRKSRQKLVEEMQKGRKDVDVYSEEGLEELEEDDEIDPAEEGFMEGELEEGQLSKDALTGKPLLDKETVHELELDGRLYRFLNKKNADAFLEKRKNEKLKGVKPIKKKKK